MLDTLSSNKIKKNYKWVISQNKKQLMIDYYQLKSLKTFTKKILQKRNYLFQLHLDLLSFLIFHTFETIIIILLRGVTIKGQIQSKGKKCSVVPLYVRPYYTFFLISFSIRYNVLITFSSR